MNTTVKKAILLWFLLTFTYAEGFAYEEELMQLLNKIERCREKKDYQQELALVKSLSDVLSYNDIILMFIPTPEQKSEYQRAERLAKLKKTDAYEQYKAMFAILEYQAKLHVKEPKKKPFLYIGIDRLSGYFKEFFSGYCRLWEYTEKSSTAYKNRCIILALASLEKASAEKFNVAQDSIMAKMQNLLRLCFSRECLAQQTQECHRAVRQIEIPQEADDILYLYRNSSSSDEELKLIAEALHRIGYTKGSFLLGNYYVARRNMDQALVYLEECKKKGDSDGTLLYSFALFSKYGYKKEQRQLMYQSITPLIQSENFDKYAAYVYGTLLEKGDCCPADTVAALDYYIRAYEQAAYKSVRDAAYSAHRKLFDAYEGKDAAEVISTNTAIADTKQMSSKERMELAQYYIELNDTKKMSDVLLQGVLQKDEACMIFLAERYYDGKGLKQNYEKAVYYTQMALAVNPKNIEALNNMAVFLAFGYGIFPDIDLALKYIDQSIAYGNVAHGPAMKQGIIDRSRSSGLKQSAVYHEKQHEEKKALYFYNRAANKGDLEARYKVALAYLSGIGAEQNKQTGIEYLKKALPYAKAKAKLQELGE